MKTHYSAPELAALKLPGLPGTERNMRSVSERENWKYREVAARGRTGKRKEFEVASLPAAARQALLQQQLIAPENSINAENTAALPVAAQPATGLFLPNPNNLTDKQRSERNARNGALLAIRRLQGQSGCSQEAAMTTLLTTARAGKLEPTLDKTLRMARDTRGRSGDGYPSIRTLKRWLTAPDLAPKVAQQNLSVPQWAPFLMKLYAQPQKPSLTWCMEELPKLLPQSVSAPSYSAARRFIGKIGNVERQRGRVLPREIKTLLPFVRRDTAHLWPGDMYTADGHTFDAEVSHPDHGHAFRPELTSVLDIATRKCVGWSAGLAESTWSVMDAQRHAFETNGICAGWYVDNGSGYINAVQSDEVTGFANQIGFEIHHSLPYNSQARGIEERSHKSIWVRGAKTLPTYIGADMDMEARQKVFKITRAHIKQAGASPLLMAWDTFLRWCQEQVDAYNARPHKGLPKMRDPANGKMRHMSPNDAWQKALDEGWAPHMFTAAERDDLFRPQKVCSVMRGEVRFRNNLYFSHELTEFHGDKVRVAYDIHDASRVWVRDMAGKLICIAEFEANKRAYFPQSVIDQDRDKRAKAREKRLENHLQEVRDELNPPNLLEHAPMQAVPVMEIVPRVEEPIEIAKPLEKVVAIESAKRKFFATDPEKYRWLMQNKSDWSESDAAWLLKYVAGEKYYDLLERYAYQGVAWTEEDDTRARMVEEEAAGG